MSNKIHEREYFDWLLQIHKTKGSQCERCIIYCQTVNQCSTVFATFSVCLGSQIYLKKWNEHVDNVIKKVSRRIYFLIQLKRAKVPPKDLSLSYVT